jgi:hypothetical protein
VPGGEPVAGALVSPGPAEELAGAVAAVPQEGELPA